MVRIHGIIGSHRSPMRRLRIARGRGGRGALIVSLRAVLGGRWRIAILLVPRCRRRSEFIRVRAYVLIIADGAPKILLGIGLHATISMAGGNMLRLSADVMRWGGCRLRSRRRDIRVAGGHMSALSSSRGFPRATVRRRWVWSIIDAFVMGIINCFVWLNNTIVESLPMLSVYIV